MEPFAIIAADHIKGSGLDLLRREFGEAAVAVRGPFQSEEELRAGLAVCDALLVRSGTRVTAAALAAAGPRLRLVGRAGVGTDNIDKAAATARGIVVMNTPSGNTISAAEHTIALVFATARNLARADRQMQSRRWDKKGLVGTEVHGKTLGIVGLGKIGQHVAKVLKAAGMEVIAYDPFLDDERAKQLAVEKADIDDLLARADFVTLHTPLTDATRNLLSAGRIARMKPGARLINCARGGIVDEAALAEAVRSGRLAGAGIDVFSQEPATDGPLFGEPGILLTPHLGASTGEAEERCGLQLAEQVVAYFRHGRIENAVNVDVAIDPDLKPWAQLAGAMARIAATLVNAPAGEIEVVPEGDLAGRDTGWLTLAALGGVLAQAGLEGVNLVNAMPLARQRGIAVGSRNSTRAQNRTRGLEIIVRGGGKETSVAGTVYPGDRQRIVQIDDAAIEIPPAEHMLFLRHPNEPGWIGAVGTLAAKHGINIEFLQVGTLLSRQRASMVLGLAIAAPEAMMDELRSLTVKGKPVERVWQVNT